MYAQAFMSFPIFIHQANGHHVATLIGRPDVQVTAPTREAALAEMRTTLRQRISKGELVFLDLEPQGIPAIAGKYADDPTLDDIREKIYRQRDAEPKE